MPDKISRMVSRAVTMDDLEVKDHPNIMPFRGTLLLVDRASDKPPQGADGHRILVPKDVAERLLPTLPGMAINYTPSLDAHAVQKKIGIITSADIKGDRVVVDGHIWKKDFPEAAEDIKANKHNLGQSMELADIYVEDKDSQVWKLKDFKFTGGTVLFKKAAAYHDTDITASRFYVKALAAAAAVLGNSNKEANMPATNGKKPSRSDSSKTLTRMAAAVGAAVSGNLNEVIESQNELIEQIQTSQDSNNKILRLLARHFVEEAKAKGNGNGKRVKAARKAGLSPTDASIDPSGRDPSADSSGDMSAAADDDDLTAALAELEEDEVKAARGDDSTDDSTGDGSDDASCDDGSMKSKADASADSTSDPSYDPSQGVQAEFDADDDHGSSKNEDASTGEFNKRAIQKYRKNSRAHLSASSKRRSMHAAADNGEWLAELRAADGRISELQAAIGDGKKKNKKLARIVAALQAQVERASEVTNRRTLSPETITMLRKANIDPGELRASGEKMSTEQVDAVIKVLESHGIKLDSAERMKTKNELYAAGMMETGEIQRYQ